MLPNRYPDDGGDPEYNSADASLWFVVAVQDTLSAMEAAGRPAAPRDQDVLRSAIETILEGYAHGTRFGIRMDIDGLLAAGEPGVQLTWMDARIGDRVLTPRIGKPVEVQALWVNALAIGARTSPRWREPLARAMRTFPGRFWNEERGCLHDVVDVDHRPGTTDPSLRPNQVLALGGLPLALVEGTPARRALGLIEQRLLTPLGLRSLAPGEPGYMGRYAGGPEQRDAAYHQGTAWPWLLGPFVEAWVRSRGGTAKSRADARKRFLDPLLSRLREAGLESVPEIADGDPPHAPRGCPFQAWSVGEVIRMDRVILKEP